MSLQLSVIIVNFNVKYFLEQCLYSVLKAAEKLDCEIFVVDNNSSDGSKTYLQTKFPKVIFQWNHTNQGFGKASNSVLPEVKGEHILFLNPDTLLPEDCFINCLAFFKEHPHCGGLGVRMLDGAGKFLKESKRGFPSPRGSFFKLAGLAKIFPGSKLFAQYYAGHLSEFQSSEVDVLAGAFMMLSKKTILATGGFDEDFFMYGEDIDLSYRIRQAGMSNYYFAGTSIIHFKGESTQKFSDHYIKHFYGAMELFVNKHYPGNKKAQRWMILAIRASQSLAKLKRHKNEKQPPPAILHTALVASQQSFNDCVALVKHAEPPVMLVGRISPVPNENKPAIGDLLHLPETIRAKKIGQVIFCEPDVSFKEIINVVERTRTNATFLFHSNGSQSIVGSSNKDSRGIFIAYPQGRPHHKASP